MKQHFFEFDPVFKSTIWGGDKIAGYKGDGGAGSGIGESWELSAVPGNETKAAQGLDKGLSLSELCSKYGRELLGERCVSRFGNTFPLLIKIIDAKLDLSVQVHPDDALAMKRHNSMGKTEMWFVVETEKDAAISCGFRRGLDPARLDDVIHSGRLRDDYLANHKSAPGDCFFIPAGRVHSIGAGNLLVEIQQSSDVTYRIDDFNRRDAAGNLRELHVDLAKDAIDYSVKPDYRTHYEMCCGQPVTLVSCDYFNTDIISLDKGMQASLPRIDSFRVVVCVEGEITITSADTTESLKLTQGHTALIASEASDIKLSTETPGAKALITYL